MISIAELRPDLPQKGVVEDRRASGEAIGPSAVSMPAFPEKGLFHVLYPREVQLEPRHETYQWGLSGPDRRG